MAKTRTPEERHRLNKEIGTRCQAARIAAGLTQEKLAEKLDVSTQYISDMERGVAGLALLTLLDLSRQLSVTTDYLIAGTEPEKSNSHIIQIGPRIIELTEKEYHIVEKSINVILEALKINE